MKDFFRGLFVFLYLLTALGQVTTVIVCNRIISSSFMQPGPGTDFLTFYPALKRSCLRPPRWIDESDYFEVFFFLIIIFPRKPLLPTIHYCDLFSTGNHMISSAIGGFHALSGDTNNNGEMNKCWWTNKTS